MLCIFCEIFLIYLILVSVLTALKRMVYFKQFSLIKLWPEVTYASNDCLYQS